jgi:hypothetical protein
VAFIYNFYFFHRGWLNKTDVTQKSAMEQSREQKKKKKKKKKKAEKLVTLDPHRIKRSISNPFISSFSTIHPKCAFGPFIGSKNRRKQLKTPFFFLCNTAAIPPHLPLPHISFHSHPATPQPCF